MITRFAPSPTNNTGDEHSKGLHIGGTRTLLYNWMISKKHLSKILLRLEDTDEARSNDDCFKCILRDTEMLGIDFSAGFKIKDGKPVEFGNENIGPLRQSQRKDIYNKYFGIALKEGLAYEKDNALFFKTPKEEVSFNDRILGKLTMPRDQAQDFVIRKSSGMPIFYFCNLVDDIEMGVDLVIRGQEHILSAHKQVAICKSLGLKEMEYGHIPLLMNPDGSKMSKRQTCGQVNFYDFIRDGYCVPAIIRYLILPELNSFDVNDFIREFSIEKIGKANTKFDYKKLLDINRKYLSSLTIDNLANEIGKYGHKFYPEEMTSILKNVTLQQLAILYHDKVKTLKEVFENSKFLIISNDNKQQSAISKETIEAIDSICQLVDWTVENINRTLEDIAKTKNIKIGPIAKEIRATLTGQDVSPPIDRVIFILGKNKVKEKVLQYAGV